MIRRLLLVAVVVALLAGGAFISRRDQSGADDVSAATTTEATTTTTMTTTTTTMPPTTTTTRPPVPIPVPTEPDATPTAPPPVLPESFDGVGTITVARGGADLVTTPGGEPFVRAREGLVLAGLGMTANRRWVRVFHMCDGTAWVDAAEVAAAAPAPDVTIGRGFDFADAVVVVDAGHGGPSNIGAQSPDGLLEKDINVVIAARLRDLLSGPHTIDWETGDILIGDEVPPAVGVIMTRNGDGPDADYEAGLEFRARVANTANAHAMVSIHNNAGWEREVSLPGSEVYYQSQPRLSEPSRRLAVLLVEEFRREFGVYDVGWVGSSVLGAKSRLSPRDGASQYYGLLEDARVPTVIAEGAYLSNQDEADLLRTPEFQQAYAEAVYRALIRFLTTDEPGEAPSHDPEVWTGFAGRGGAQPDCRIPEQR